MRVLNLQWGGLLQKDGVALREKLRIDRKRVPNLLRTLTFLRDYTVGSRAWKSTLWQNAFSRLAASLEKDSTRTPKEVYENRNVREVAERAKNLEPRIGLVERVRKRVKEVTRRIRGGTQTQEIGGRQEAVTRVQPPKLESAWDSDREPTLVRVGASFDGGGTRGLMSAYMVRELESLTGQHPIKLFDIMGGTSTGALIAAGFVAPDSSGRLPLYSGTDIVQLFERNMSVIFGTIVHNSLEKVLYWLKKASLRSQYDPAPIEKILKEKFGDIPLRQALRPLVVTAVDQETSRLELFKSFDAVRSPPQYDIHMRTMLRATTAAPTFFPAARMSFGERDRIFLDGGVLRNYPAVEVDDEVERIYPGEARSVVSIGTGMVLGRPRIPEDGGTVNAVGHLVEIVMTHEAQEAVNREMTRRCDRSYMRIQPHFTRNIPLDSVSEKDRDSLEEAFESRLPDLEGVARFLLINNDNWKDSGFDRQTPLGAQTGAAVLEQASVGAAAASSASLPNEGATRH